jgi:hypothetical protein
MLKRFGSLGILLSPEGGEGGGGDTDTEEDKDKKDKGKKTEGDEGNGDKKTEADLRAELETLKKSVNTLESTLGKVRDEKKSAEQKAKDAEEKARQASLSVEERIAILENEKLELKLAGQRNKAVKDALKKLPETHTCDESAVLELLEEMKGSLTLDNVDAKVARVVERLKTLKEKKPGDDNKQHRDDRGGPEKFDWNKRERISDALTASKK